MSKKEKRAHKEAGKIEKLERKIDKRRRKLEQRAKKQIQRAEKKARKHADKVERKENESGGMRLDGQKLKMMIKKLRAQFGLQPIIIVLAAAAAMMIMTWLIRDVLDVQHIYAAAGFELIGVVAVLLGFMLPFNIILYRRRKREVITLSQAIQTVASGDFESRIPTDKKAQITPIYEDFNKMCDELQSVQVLRNDFINNYSHEFKTPIASINGFAEFLLEKKDLSQDEQRQYLEIIAEESSRLSKFAADTTLLSKLSAQQIMTGMERYDLSEQLRQCSIILSCKWLDKKQDFSGELMPVQFYGNKEVMQHLWINLMDNAIKYTPKGGKITVRNFVENENIIVEVEDNGEGISEEVQRHLFTPYFQGDSSHSRQGLGLGLSIAMRVVELCDGEISVDSTVGRGSVFRVKLPLG